MKIYTCNKFCKRDYYCIFFEIMCAKKYSFSIFHINMKYSVVTRLKKSRQVMIIGSVNSKGFFLCAFTLCMDRIRNKSTLINMQCIPFSSMLSTTFLFMYFFFHIELENLLNNRYSFSLHKYIMHHFFIFSE